MARTHILLHDRPRRRPWAYGLLGAVVCAFLLQTLAWSRMPASMHDRLADGFWVICTLQGPETVSIPGDEPGPALPSAGIHCDLCVFAQGLGTAPGIAVRPLASLTASLAGVPATVHPPRSPAFYPQQARAPPIA